MELVDISHNDDLRTVVFKCNINFKNLAFGSSDSLRKQSRKDIETNTKALNDAVEGLTNVTIPNEVTRQIQALDIPQTIHNEVDSQINAFDIPGKIDDAIQDADIPLQVSQEVASRISDAYPPIGSYIIMTTSPDASYAGTTWSQVDTITTDNSMVLPLWQRQS